MAERGFMGAEQGEKQPVPSFAYNAHQDEFGFQEGINNNDHGYGGDTGKSGYGHGATSEEQSTQFGLEGKTGNYGYGRHGGQGVGDLPGTTTKTNDFGRVVDPMESNFDKAPHGIEAVPGGDGWSAEDTSPVHGAKKDGLMNKIRQKLPGQHELADGSVTNQPDPNAPPKKGLMEKIKEKLPGM